MYCKVVFKCQEVHLYTFCTGACISLVSSCVLITPVHSLWYLRTYCALVFCAFAIEKVYFNNQVQPCWVHDDSLGWMVRGRFITVTCRAVKTASPTCIKLLDKSSPQCLCF
jgi:hypothetical protein